jgi:hypothetical protein
LKLNPEKFDWLLLLAGITLLWFRFVRRFGLRIASGFVCRLASGFDCRFAGSGGRMSVECQQNLLIDCSEVLPVAEAGTERVLIEFSSHIH